MTKYRTIKVSYLICFICIFWNVLFFGACTRPGQVDKLLVQADSIIYSHTDSAEYILDKIANDKFSERQKADYWRLRTTSHVLKRKSTVEDSMVIFALDYYKKHNMQKELKVVYKLVLNHLLWKNDTQSYDHYILGASEFAQQVNDSLFTCDIFKSKADNLYSRNDYKQAYQYYVKASEYDSSSSIYYMAALTYEQMECNDTVDYWMQKAIDLAKQEKDTASISHYYRNYADIQIDFKEYDKALVTLRNLVKYEPDSFNEVSYAKATIFLQQHKLDSAQYYLNKTLEKYSVSHEKSSFLFTRKGLTFFQSLISYGKGGPFDFKLIGQYTDSLLMDKFYRIRKIEEQVLVKEKLLEQNHELIVKRQRTQLLLLSILSLTLIVGAVVYLYIKRKKDKLYQMEEKMESLKVLLADASDSLKSSRENSSYFKKVLLQQLGLIRLTASSPTIQNQEMLRHITKITNEEVPVDSMIIWGDLYVLIDSLYNNFYTKMKNSFGDILTEKEMQLCCLLCADFTTKEISVITQQSVRTIYQRKTSIRMKLDMQQAEDIVEFIGK